MKENTLLTAIDLVSDELNRTKNEDFNGRTVSQAEAFEESKAANVKELTEVLDDLNQEHEKLYPESK